MRLAGDNGQGAINYSFNEAPARVHAMLLAAKDSKTPSPARRIWELASEELKQSVGRIKDAADKRAPASVVRLLNEVLRRRDLCDSDVWRVCDPEAHPLMRKQVEDLNDDEVMCLNRGLIASAFPGELYAHPGLTFETYYATWLERLLDTRLFDMGRCSWSVSEDWSGEQPPCGFLLDYDPDEQSAIRYAPVDSEDDIKEWHGSLTRFATPPFHGTPLPAAPVHMSSGFHQLAPIIVQAGLMAANAILCIENPEVHLHPKLQLDIAEFFVRQASISKYMILETHSDLVVRRVMRAVLSEELRQEAVRLYFAHMHSESKHIGNRLEWINRETSEIWPFAVAYRLMTGTQMITRRCDRDERSGSTSCPGGRCDLLSRLTPGNRAQSLRHLRVPRQIRLGSGGKATTHDRTLRDRACGRENQIAVVSRSQVVDQDKPLQAETRFQRNRQDSWKQAELLRNDSLLVSR
jgi:AAA ATPase domain